MQKRILIVEDQGALSDALARRFARRGFGVEECQNTSSALNLLRTQKFDLVVCDINLEEQVSGLDLLATVRSENLDMPFVFLTGHAEGTEEMNKALNAGAAGVFSKPTDFSVLLHRVCVLLGLSAEDVSRAGSK